MRLNREKQSTLYHAKVEQMKADEEDGKKSFISRYMTRMPPQPVGHLSRLRRDSLESELRNLAASRTTWLLARLALYVAISLLPFALRMVYVTNSGSAISMIQKGHYSFWSQFCLKSIFIGCAFNPYVYFLTDARVRKKVGHFFRMHFPVAISRIQTSISAITSSKSNQRRVKVKQRRASALSDPFSDRDELIHVPDNPSTCRGALQASRGRHHSGKKKSDENAALPKVVE